MDIKFSDSGTNDRIKEEQSYMFFVQLLNECEGKLFYIPASIFIVLADTPCEDNLALEEILIFFSGSDYVPPLGFIPDPTLSFHKKDFPTASTCSLRLTLPLHQDYETFKNKVKFGIRNCHSFERP